METKKMKREREKMKQTKCLVSDQNSNDSNGATTPSGGGKSGCIQLNVS